MTTHTEGTVQRTPEGDFEYPYDRARELRIMQQIDESEQRYGEAYADALGRLDTFDPAVMLYAYYFKPGVPAVREVPHMSGEGAIYTPEHLAEREGNPPAHAENWWLYAS